MGQRSRILAEDLRVRWMDRAAGVLRVVLGQARSRPCTGSHRCGNTPAGAGGRAPLAGPVQPMHGPVSHTPRAAAGSSRWSHLSWAGHPVPRSVRPVSLQVPPLRRRSRRDGGVGRSPGSDRVGACSSISRCKQLMPVLHVAAQHGLSWATVRQAEQHALERWDRLAALPSAASRGDRRKYLGRRNRLQHKYVTIVSNLETGEPVWIGYGRGKGRCESGSTPCPLPRRRRSSCLRWTCGTPRGGAGNPRSRTRAHRPRPVPHHQARDRRARRTAQGSLLPRGPAAASTRRGTRSALAALARLGAKHSIAARGAAAPVPSTRRSHAAADQGGGPRGPASFPRPGCR